MAIKPEDQLLDSGAVIGYRPNITYDKENTSTSEESSIIDDYINDNESYTDTINSYLNSLPSSIIEDLSTNIITINDIIDRLKDHFKSNQYSDYANIENYINAIESGNLIYANEFLQFHKENISNSQIPEIIYTLELEKNRLTVFTDTLKTLYYGTANIKDEECKQRDEDVISILKQRDVARKGINYLPLSCDSILNKTIRIYSSKVDSSIIQLEDCAYIEESNAVPATLSSTLEYMFNETDDELNDRTKTYDVQQSIDTAKKALYNYYTQRNELNQYYNAVANTQEEDSFLLSKVPFYERKLKNAIEDVNRTMVGNVYYMNTLETLMAEKQHLRSLYATISYT